SVSGWLSLVFLGDVGTRHRRQEPPVGHARRHGLVCVVPSDAGAVSEHGRQDCDPRWSCSDGPYRGVPLVVLCSVGCIVESSQTPC
ncbi:hypothetical protein ACR6JC_24380, partial [Citrobacter europaeus]|uniref:hypothetical protein n=1 Tax=Citrobacter europaeus TaxID=1914243 RepID=UPI003ED8D2B2